MTKKTEISKEKRIKAETKRIEKFFCNLGDNQREIIQPLIQNAAFMRATLDDLQEIINTEGVTDQYQNGNNQYGTKPSANLQSYNTLIKNYAGVMKQLINMLPPEDRKDRLIEFVEEYR